MRLAFGVFITIITSTCVLAQDTAKAHAPFFELGAGHLLNGGGTSSYFVEDILVDHVNFDHGVSAYLHFGLPVMKSRPLVVGLAGKYAVHLGMQYSNKLAKHYENEFPTLKFTYHTPPWFINNVQIGPYIRTATWHNWGADLELLFGYARVRAPALTILGEADYKYYVYVSRLPTVNHIRTISPAFGVRRYIGENKYLFARADLTFGIGKLMMDFYDYYPDGQSYTYLADYDQVYDHDYYLFSLLIGTNISLGK